MVEYVLRDGDGNVISREDDAEDVGYNEDTSPDPEPEDDDSGGGGSTAERTGVVRDPETGDTVEADSEQAQNIDMTPDSDFNTGTSDSSGNSGTNAGSNGVQKVDEENIERLDLPERQNDNRLETDQNIPNVDIGDTTGDQRKIRQKVNPETGRLQEAEVVGRGNRVVGDLREVVERQRQQEERQRRNRNQPSQEIQARRQIFERQREQTRENFRELLGEEKPEIKTPDFGTINNQEFYRTQRLEQQSGLSEGELDIIRTAATQSEIEGAARRGGEQITGSELGGSIAVGGQSLATDPLIIADQTGSILSASTSNPNEISTLPGRAAEGFPKVVTEIVENPIEEAAPEILTGISGGTSISVSSSQTPTFVDSSSTVLNPEKGPTNTFNSELTTENVPSQERVPDLGEQSIGKGTDTFLREPESQLTGENFLEETIVRQPSRQTQTAETGFGEPRGEASFTGRGRDPGVPENTEGLTPEEVEVLEQRRTRQGSNVDTTIEGFAEDSRAATDVRFERTVDRRGDVTISESVDSSTESGGLLTGTRKGRTSGIPLVREKPSTRDTVDPDVDGGFGEVNVDQGENINIIDNRRSRGQTRSDPRSDTDFNVDLDSGVFQGSFLGSTQGQSQRQAPGLDQDQDQGLDLDLGSGIVSDQGTSTGGDGFTPDSGTEPSLPGLGEFITDNSTNTPTNTFSVDTSPERDNNNRDNGLLDLFSREQERNVQRSVGADLLGLESEELSETEATNPLSLRGFDES